MKRKNKLMYGLAAAFCLAALMGCGNAGSPQMANELRFSTDNLSEVTISYDEENLTFFDSDSDELVIREYMTAKKSRYYAKVDKRRGSVKISEGKKPFFKHGFLRYIEVYLPASYHENLTITTTDGEIDLSDMELDLSALRIDSTDGKIQLKSAQAQTIYLSSTRGILNLGDLKAEQIQLKTTSGNTVCENLEGNVTYTSTSGDARIEAAVGGGSYKADNSGKLEVTYVKVTDDLYLFNKNDDVKLTLPDDLAFEFQATTKNGVVSTNFQESITVDGQTAKGTVGSQPTVAVEVETRNGNVEVTQ